MQKLSDQNIPPNQIVQITGHKNLQSVNNYSHVNDNQHKNISKILSNTSANLTQNNSIYIYWNAYGPRKWKTSTLSGIFH